jgi:hypothetical protein
MRANGRMGEWENDMWHGNGKSFYTPMKIYTREDLKPHPYGVLWFKL